MGYDMRMVQTPASVPPNIQLQNPESPGYHRLNIRAMPLVREMMQVAGALDDCGEPVTPFPDWPPKGITEERAYELMDPDPEDPPQPPATKEEQALIDRYRAERDVVLAELGEDGHVGYWKFCSNDGWLVTPDECRIIADVLTSALERREPLWDDLDITEENARDLLLPWIGFNRLAADHGGYRVR
jgi:hypothetical protein